MSAPARYAAIDTFIFPQASFIERRRCRERHAATIFSHHNAMHAGASIEREAATGFRHFRHGLFLPSTSLSLRQRYTAQVFCDARKQARARMFMPCLFCHPVAVLLFSSLPAPPALRRAAALSRHYESSVSLRRVSAMRLSLLPMSSADMRTEPLKDYRCRRAPSRHAYCYSHRTYATRQERHVEYCLSFYYTTAPRRRMVQALYSALH